MPASLNQSNALTNLRAVPLRSTTEYWNFVFSFANWRGIDRKQFLALVRSVASAYFAISFKYAEIIFSCSWWTMPKLWLSTNWLTTAGIPPTIIYSRRYSIIFRWMESSTLVLFMKCSLNDSITSSDNPIAHKYSSKSNEYILTCRS